MSDDEIDFSEAKPTKAGEVLEHFNKPLDPPTFGPEDVDALQETPMAYKEICEPLLKELYVVTNRRKSVEKYEKELKDEFKKLVGLDRGMIQRGAFGAKVADTSGRKTTNWLRAIISIKFWVCDQIAKNAIEAAEVKAKIDAIVEANADPAVPGIKIEPYVVGKGDSLESE